MNRIIKFRGKRTGNGVWEYGNLIFDYNTAIIVPFGKVKGFLVDNDTVGQLVKAIDGKEFYEGDIARTKDELKLIVILTWIDQHSMYGWLTVEEYNKYKDVEYIDFDKILFWTYAFNDETVKGIEIIGNIHDNKDLITTK